MSATECACRELHLDDESVGELIGSAFEAGLALHLNPLPALTVGLEDGGDLEPGLLSARARAAAAIVPSVPFGRPLYGPEHPKGPTVGPDVLAWKRMLWRWDAGVFAGPAGTFDDVFNRRAASATRVAQRAWGITATGNVGHATFVRSLRALRARGAYKPTESAWDDLALKLYRDARPRVPLAACWLLPKGVAWRNLGGVAAHMSRPLGNWQSDHAVDVGADPGTLVLAIGPGYVSKVGGRDPRLGPSWPLFGQHVTLELNDGDAVFVTHLHREVSLGERVVAGEVIGRIADWPGSTSMDHAHVGTRRRNPELLDELPHVAPRT